MNDSPLLLLVLMAALIAVPLVLKRFKRDAPDAVRVLGRTALHKGAVVAVIAVGDRRMLIGAGDRGVHLLAELEDAASAADRNLDVVGTSTTTMTESGHASFDLTRPTSSDARKDAVLGHPAMSAHDAFAELEFVSSATTEGPRIGLVDRLRAMTVRTPVQGRPFHVPLRR